MCTVLFTIDQLHNYKINRKKKKKIVFSQRESQAWRGVPPQKNVGQPCMSVVFATLHISEQPHVHISTKYIFVFLQLN